jgi:hypothetical protein
MRNRAIEARTNGQEPEIVRQRLSILPEKIKNIEKFAGSFSSCSSILALHRFQLKGGSAGVIWRIPIERRQLTGGVREFRLLRGGKTRQSTGA